MQLSVRSESTARSQSNQLLAQAMEAMELDNLDLAAQYLEQAERLNVDYSGLLHRISNTPEKVRRQLESRFASRANQGQVPSRQYSPTPVRQQGTSALVDPFSAQEAGSTVPIESITDASKARAVRFLSQAHAELERNNITGAIGLYQQAVAQNAQFAPNEYSPEHLANELRSRNVDVRQLARPAAPLETTGTNPNQLLPDATQQAVDRIISSGSSNAASQVNTTPLSQPNSGQPTNAQTNSIAPTASQGDSRDSRFGPTDPPPSIGQLPTPTTSSHPDKAEATRLMAQARLAISQGNLNLAESLIVRAKSLRIPDTAFGQGDMNPWSLDLELDRAHRRQQEAVLASSESAPSTYDASQGVYRPDQDTTRVEPAQNSTPANPLPGPTGPLADGLSLIERGEQALTRGNVEEARRLFEQAWGYENIFDAPVRQRLQEQLQVLRPVHEEIIPGAPEGVFEAVDAEQSAALQQVFNEVSQTVHATLETYQTQPLEALDALRELRSHVGQTNIDADSKRQMMMRIDRNIATVEVYIDQNRAQISLDQANASVLAQLDRERRTREETHIQLAEIVEQFNQLIDQQRFAEAVVLAKQARELDPHNPVVVTLVQTAQNNMNYQRAVELNDLAADGFQTALGNVDEARIPYDDNDPLQFPDRRYWEDMTARRREALSERNQGRMSEIEREIRNSLKKPIEVRFDNRPLTEVIEILQTTAGVNIYLDPQGLAAEGVTSDTPITINLTTRPVSLKSALNLILHPLQLDYIIQDEVLRITSEGASENDLSATVYNVADLVIPIPNFVPSYNIGIPGALQQAVQALGHGQAGWGGGGGSMPLTMVADNNSAGNSMSLAQQYSAGGRPSMASGPGGMGGGVEADFDTLIELITQTIEPTSWDEIGGPGSIAGFDTNLSLVISQTQEVHEQIVDLLEQLRRLQDLQVTIEVRFITLSDSFFERIGVDFNFQIDDGNNSNLVPTVDDDGPSMTVGLSGATVGGIPAFTGDLDLEFNQGTFGVGVPAFGTPSPAGVIGTNAANFGFAILSDIEAFFFVQALQGDSRSNILAAPKVTLFNGQQAFVSNTLQRPFVTSLIPVVGDFAAAQQPVVIVLSEGTALSVQAVVSPDRRFVRLTLIPFFSEIGKVDTFTFSGSTTTNTGTTVVDPSDPNNTVTNGVSTTVEGTTVQLPTFAFTTVTTTVSVPDGGTILLGGIKSLSEGRDEQGVPMLSKIPYINRLFRNVGIARTSSSLMMMVTPRIIIQEEEESLMGFNN